MDVLSGAEGQFTNKLLVDISGTIKGFVKNVDIEMVEGKILIHMKLGQSAESYGLSRSESKLLRFETKITIVADEIVSVGKDCIIVSKGKLPPLEEIKKAKIYKAENDSLKVKLNEVNEELENSLRKLKVLKEDKSELEFKLNKMLKMEEEFSELRLKCAKLEGEVEASKRFIEKYESQTNQSGTSQFVASQPSYKPIEDEIEETLDQEKQKRFEDILKDDFTLFGEEETLYKEPKEQKVEETTVPVNETCTDETERSNLNISNENPFKKFSKEYKKDDLV
ncbi:MAG: hypothetical protein APG12_00929 [Candidatus Methanofastidiosum methylothiophilum]|uniref:Uncharacterized protein n=1 Tax=Candidatus Methanofastidiosum methylothiophilum TaxID=1705564 RepID=A0A150IRS1_9EURY|nr:MAG: hypothetical protein APG10_00743 [Candidatus Methanofastidiosum methylthiophilus]KYC47683.1 MAG: hypothetical protein APG11_00929 [Candidatus Methanofastidiosum methylthiophilus]KYC50311.1 MAG: hypothetical protein APG12_00929 [Candidatus Methanofastidiosum methylthiophilus]